MNYKRTLQKRPAAKEDLIHIWLYISVGNEDRANSFLYEIEQKMILLKEFPYIGVEKNNITEGLRFLPHKSYNIYYTVEATSITIIRVVRSSQKISNIF